MNDYHRHVSGFFADRDAAENTLAKLVEVGLAREQLQIFETDAPASEPAPKKDSNAVLKDVIVDGTIGTVVGTGLGALAEVALVATNVSLFIASPLMAPLAMLGWGASLGAILGVTAGMESDAGITAGKKEGWLSDLIRDAIANGQIVLLAITKSEQETAFAREVMKEAVGDFKDISTP